jgi:hypothetical protein
MADWWKKYSVPSAAAMNPKPLSVSRLIVPFVFGAMSLIGVEQRTRTFTPLRARASESWEFSRLN